jgi:hypothetical protein
MSARASTAGGAAKVRVSETLHFPCPSCQVQAGKRCRNYKGNLSPEPCRDRLALVEGAKQQKAQRTEEARRLVAYIEDHAAYAHDAIEAGDWSDLGDQVAEIQGWANRLRELAKGMAE